MSDPVRIARVALRVSDVERSAEFYAGVAALEPRDSSPDRAALAAPGGGPVLLELRRSERPGPAPRRATGLFHTAFRYRNRPQLGAVLRRLARARAPLSGASDHLVSEALYLEDPDGLGIELYRDRPREQWPAPAPGERIRMDTIALDIDGVLGEPEPEEPVGSGMDIGHVHLKVRDVEPAVQWWTERAGLELMTRFGSQAVFLASGGYHHHVGANTWMSAGADPEPADEPGLDAVVLAVSGDPGVQAARGRLGGAEGHTPEGLRVALVQDRAVVADSAP